MNTPHIYRVRGGHLIATPIVGVRAPFDYCSTRAIAGVDLADECMFNAFMEGYEVANPWLDEMMHMGRSVAMPNYSPCFIMTMTWRNGAHSAISGAKLRARFPWITDEISMSLRIRGEVARVRIEPMSESELVACGLDDERIPQTAAVFPIQCLDAGVSDDPARHEIPAGYNNYAMTRDFISWDLYWR